jgi:sterol desaturase/sphingolipid hydroxylase (fatty acid hydroxylase superfamily)
MDAYQRLSELWLRIADQWRGSERILFTGGLFASSFVPFWSISLFLFYCYKHNLFPQWRIQKGRMPDPELSKKGLRHVLFTQLVVQPVAAYMIYPYFVACGVQIHAPLPHPLRILLDLAVAIIVNDTLFYWSHRILHHKSI